MRKFLKLKKSLSKLVICIFFLWSTESYAFEDLDSKNKNINANKLNLELVSPKRDFYLLGSGDALSIEFQGLENKFPKSFKVDQDGNIFLPRLKKVFVEGLTVGELTALLSSEYEKYMINPDLIINVEDYRKVGVFVFGEVTNPGYYILEDFIKEKSLQPTLFDAIRNAGGITPYSSIDNIKVVRNVSRLQEEGKIQTEINLMSTILDGEGSQNIKIYDQDQIFISKSNSLLKDQYLKAIKTNMNPKSIRIFISGRVRETKEYQLPKATTLNQAISVAGGIKPISGRIEFIRITNQGMDKRVFNMSSNSESGTYKNPFLQHGDIIRVRDSIFSNAAEAIGELTKPAIGIFAIDEIFN